MILAQGEDADVDHPDREPVLIGPAPRADYHTHMRERAAPALAGDGVALLRAAVQARERLCREAQVLTTIEAEHAEPQSAPTKKAA